MPWEHRVVMNDAPRPVATFQTEDAAPIMSRCHVERFHTRDECEVTEDARLIYSEPAGWKRERAGSWLLGYRYRSIRYENRHYERRVWRHWFEPDGTHMAEVVRTDAHVDYGCVSFVGPWEI